MNIDIWRTTLFMALIYCGISPALSASKKIPHRKAITHVQAQAAHSYAQHPDALAFAETVAQQQPLELAWVKSQLSEAQSLPTVIKLMTPAAVGSKKNWQLYRSRFVTPVHINAGVSFWHANQALLTKAQAQYGVPPHIVMGILGVETIFGRNTGSFRVLDALATLAFDYPLKHPRREARITYFRGELEQFLIMCQRLQVAPNSIKGSFAGAMGWPQFMPSSWMKHAVDFDGDGRVDLWGSPADMIGSVANYFKAYGWKAQPEPHSSPTIELENGAHEATQYPVDSNFFVITQYNNSYYYAAAVLDLGLAIADKMNTSTPK